MVGCAVSPESPTRLNPVIDQGKIQELTDGQVLGLYLYNVKYKNLERAAKILMDVERRKLFPLEERHLILSQTLKVGMSERGMWLAMGRKWNHINRSVGSYGIHKQYVYKYRHGCSRYEYGYSGYCKRVYVYVENGKVTGWQN